MGNLIDMMGMVQDLSQCWCLQVNHGSKSQKFAICILSFKIIYIYTYLENLEPEIHLELVPSELDDLKKKTPDMSLHFLSPGGTSRWPSCCQV